MESTIGQRIKAHRKSRRMTLTELEKITGIGNGNLSRLERGKQGLTSETMAAIAAAFGISLAELFADSRMETVDDNTTNAHVKAQLVTFYRSLTDIPEGANILINSVQVVASAKKSDHVCWEADPKTPISFVGDHIRSLDSKPGFLLSFRIRDDAMQPRLYPGDYVVIDSHDVDVPDTGGVFAVVVDARAIAVRRIFHRPGGALMVACDNQTYPAINLTADDAGYITIIGRVKAMRGNGGF